MIDFGHLPSFTRQDELLQLVLSAVLSPLCVRHPHDTRRATRARLVYSSLSTSLSATTRDQTSCKSLSGLLPSLHLSSGTHTTPDKLPELVWSAFFSPPCIWLPHDTRRATRARLSTPLSPLRFRQRHETRRAARACLVCCPLSICRLAPPRHQTSYHSSSGLLSSLPLAFGSHTTPDELQELVCLLLSLHFVFGNDTRPDALQELVWSASLSPPRDWHPHETGTHTRPDERQELV